MRLGFARSPRVIRPPPFRDGFHSPIVPICSHLEFLFTLLGFQAAHPKNSRLLHRLLDPSQGPDVALGNSRSAPPLS